MSARRRRAVFRFAGGGGVQVTFFPAVLDRCCQDGPKHGGDGRLPLSIPSPVSPAPPRPALSVSCSSSNLLLTPPHLNALTAGVLPYGTRSYCLGDGRGKVDPRLANVVRYRIGRKESHSMAAGVLEEFLTPASPATAETKPEQEEG